MTRILFSLVIGLYMVLLSDAKAQQYEFGITGAGTGYMGDLNTSNPLYFKNIGGGIFAKYNLNPTWGIRASLNYLPTFADDRDFSNTLQQNRSLFFNNDLKEFSLTADFNFFKFIAGRQINKYTPYLMAGVAVINHNPYVNNGDTKIALQDYPLEIDSKDQIIKPSKWAISVPIGMGFKYNINGPWSLGIEANYRTVLSDHVDNVSGYYRYDTDGLPTDWAYMADPSEQLSTKGGTLRGDGKKFDGYMTAGITLTYTIISSKCYWWK